MTRLGEQFAIALHSIERQRAGFQSGGHGAAVLASMRAILVTAEHRQGCDLFENARNAAWSSPELDLAKAWSVNQNTVIAKQEQFAGRSGMSATAVGGANG